MARCASLAFTPHFDNCYLLDAKGTILSVSRDLSDAETGTPVPLADRALGRSYFDFCAGPAAGAVRTEIENLLSRRTRYFSAIYDCSGNCAEFVPIALIGTAIELGRQPLFNLRHIALNYSTACSHQEMAKNLEQSLLLKDFFANPSLDRWDLIKDQAALRTLGHLFASLESIRTSMDEAVYCHDNGVTYRRLSSLLVQTAAIVDNVLEQLSPPSMARN